MASDISHGNKPHYGIVFTDIDGTLLRDDKTVSEQSRAIIGGLVAGGLRFCPISARSPRGIDPIWDELGFRGPLAAFSGGLVLDEERRVLYSCTIPLESALSIKAFLNDELADVVVNTFGFDTWITDDETSPRVQDEEHVVKLKATQCRDLASAFDDRGIHKFLLMGAPADLDVAEERVRTRFPELVVARSNANLTEVTAAGATKQHAIDVLCEHYGVGASAAVAFGDGHNDIPMLQAVPMSFAVANASDEVKRAARAVCAQTNNEDAVALTLQELISA